MFIFAKTAANTRRPLNGCVRCNDGYKGVEMNDKKLIIHILFCFCLFSFGLNQALSSENNITNYRETISVLQELYRAEIVASKTYSGFAQKAVEEKYYSVARLFSALSESESVHARNFKNILNDLGVEPEESLLYARGGGTCHRQSSRSNHANEDRKKPPS